MRFPSERRDIWDVTAVICPAQGKPYNIAHVGQITMKILQNLACRYGMLCRICIV